MHQCSTSCTLFNNLTVNLIKCFRYSFSASLYIGLSNSYLKSFNERCNSVIFPEMYEIYDTSKPRKNYFRNWKIRSALNNKNY